MKKRFLALLVVLTLALTVNSLAASKGANAKPSLTFNGNTAVCFASCKGSLSTDKVYASLSLYQGNTCIGSWNASGTGRIPVSGECTVEKGKTYTLSTADASPTYRQRDGPLRGTSLQTCRNTPRDGDSP